MGEKRPPRITIVVVLPTQEAYGLPMTFSVNGMTTIHWRLEGMNVFPRAPRLLPNQNQVYSVAKGMSSQNSVQIRQLFRHDTEFRRWNLHILRNDHHSIADDPLFTIEIDMARERPDQYAFSDAHVLVNDRSLDIAVGPDPGRNGGGRFPGS